MTEISWTIEKIVGAERLNNSASGNPRWRILFAEGERRRNAMVEKDASVNYSVKNLLGVIRRAGAPVPCRVTWTRSKTISSIEPMNGEQI